MIFPRENLAICEKSSIFAGDNKLKGKIIATAL